MSDGLPDLGVTRSGWAEYADPTRTHRVRVRGVEFGGSAPVIVAGPCAVESFEQTLGIAEAVKRLGVSLMRGGAFKPRTNPHAFRGLGVEGLEILAEVRRITGLGIVTEVMDPRLVEQVAGCADMLQVGSRAMQNFPLLTEIGRSGMPVLLKRGWSATLEEWLCAAEYIALEGNRDIVLCERGIRTGVNDRYARAVLDLSVIGAVRRLTPLPIIVDPSHAAGRAEGVPALSRAALAAGALGLLIEVVCSDADRAQLRCDNDQGVTPDILEEILAFSRSLAKATP